MKKSKPFSDIVCQILKTNFTYFCDVAIRKFQVMLVAHTLFLLDGAALGDPKWGRGALVQEPLLSIQKLCGFGNSTYNMGKEPPNMEKQPFLLTFIEA